MKQHDKHTDRKETFYVLSGEGENGTWAVVETSDIKRLLKKERCGGDRWVKAYRKADCFETKTLGVAGYDAETNEQGFIGGAAEDDFHADKAKIAS